jgi:8-oxo-dGTP diphosphatase
MKNYVLGFMFSVDKSSVVLIEKIKPDWQSGKLNGIGGKVEDKDKDFTFYKIFKNAMIREFEEETGVKTQKDEWKEFARIQRRIGDKKFFCPCYVCFSDKVHDVETQTEEKIFKFNVEELLTDFKSDILNNLNYLIPLALNFDDNLDIVTFNYS